MYIPREIEGTVMDYVRQFKVVLVTGARQVGKSTMLNHTLPANYARVSLDDLDVLTRIREDSALFFLENEPPLVIDEIQYAPELFMRIKHLVDQSGEKGLVVLTGSQTYHLMQGVCESLAGRIGILQMGSFSLREREGRLTARPYIPERVSRFDADGESAPLDLWRYMQRGSMPELANPAIDAYAYYSSYVRSYIERDVRDLVKVRDERKFYDFLVACAARTGQLLNASDIASTVGINPTTVHEWLSVLQASGIVHILRPFWANVNKRLAKTPKLFFMDTGLACHLTGWSSAETLRRGAMAGHMFETLVVSEVLKSYMNAGRDVRDVWFYRDARKREIDLVIQSGHMLHPVEIKTAVSVGADAVKNFGALAELDGYEVGFGSIICQTPKPYFVTREVQAIAPWMI